MTDDHGGDIEGAAHRYGLETGQIVDFSASINPLGPPPGLLPKLRAGLGSVRHYPQPRGGRLRQALAGRHGTSPDRVIVGNGAAELIYLACRALRPRRALLPVPAFSEYARAIAAVGGEVEYFALRAEDGFILRREMLSDRLRAGSYDLLVLGNPNNPTGNLLSGTEVDGLLADAAAGGTFVLVDEAFLGFVPDATRYGAARNELPGGAFIIGSFTKLFALPGLRLGYGLGPPALIKRMEGERDPWSVNTLAIAAGLDCLDQAEFIRRSVQLIEREREGLRRSLDGLGITAYPSRANFILCRLPGDGLTAAHLRDALARHGILIRDCGNFPGLDPFFFRLAVRRPAENRALVRALARVLEAKGR